MNHPPRVLIIGASSAIAEQAARIWAARGARLYLVARQEHRLAAMQADLRVRGAASVDHCVADLADMRLHAGLIDGARAKLEQLDVVLIAHGQLPPQDDDVTKVVVSTMDVNATSVMSLSEHVAIAFEAQGSGVLAVIGSVAGDRGRATNALYGAAKAAVAAHASGLRQRLVRSGAWVVTVKPGFVDTPMTRSFAKGPLWATPEAVAKGIVRAIDQRAATVYLPWFWAPIMQIIRALPEFIFVRTKF